MGMDQGVRSIFWVRVKICKLVSPWKKSLGMEVKLLLSRYSCWREERFARAGMGPERELDWREREVSWVRVLRSEGRVPERP